MDQQSLCPNYQGHHGDPLEKLLFPLKLALQRKHQDESFPSNEPNDSMNTLVADLEGRRKENFGVTFKVYTFGRKQTICRSPKAEESHKT
jgi:hypothetical protein